MLMQVNEIIIIFKKQNKPIKRITKTSSLSSLGIRFFVKSGMKWGENGGEGEEQLIIQSIPHHVSNMVEMGAVLWQC